MGNAAEMEERHCACLIIPRRVKRCNRIDGRIKRKVSGAALPVGPLPGFSIFAGKSKQIASSIFGLCTLRKWDMIRDTGLH